MRVGVVIPAYNVAPYIGDAVRSVLAQGWTDWRAVVVDDGSVDETFRIAAEFDDPRLTVVRQPNAGVSAARNHGAALLDVDAMLFLDADDWLAPDALSVLARTLEASADAVAAAGRSRRNNVTPSWPGLARPSPAAAEPAGAIGVQVARSSSATTRGLLPAALIRNPFTNGGQVLIRRSALRTAGGFRTDLRFGEDWELWIRLALRGKFATIPRIVCHVRERPGSAYNLLATDPATFAPSMHAVFGNPDLLARFGAESLARYRHRAEAENHWVIGRELLRHGRATLGRQWLQRSVAAAPTAKRVALLAACYALAVLPATQCWPLRRYAN